MASSTDWVVSASPCAKVSKGKTKCPTTKASTAAPTLISQCVDFKTGACVGEESSNVSSNMIHNPLGLSSDLPHPAPQPSGGRVTLTACACRLTFQNLRFA